MRKCVKSLTPEAVNNASLVGICRKTGRMISGSEIRRKEHNNELDSSGIIDRMAGLTTLERKAIEMKDAVADGPKIVKP